MLVVPATGHAAKGKDSDRDGLSDRFERSSSHTKPQDGDTDADGDDGRRCTGRAPTRGGLNPKLSDVEQKLKHPRSPTAPARSVPMLAPCA